MPIKKANNMLFKSKTLSHEKLLINSSEPDFTKTHLEPSMAKILQFQSFFKQQVIWLSFEVYNSFICLMVRSNVLNRKRLEHCRT